MTGSVVDTSGQGIPSVTIAETGASNTVISSSEGSFQIEVKSQNAVLHFSSVGYISISVNVAGQSSLTVTLQSSSTSLGEIVVIGYGSVPKRDLTSAVTTVTSKDFIPGAVNSPLQLIEGKVAGVVISNPAAADPNRNTDVQIRGASSIEAGNGPLIVIDGMPGGDLRNVTQQDIESITVLKDASASAIYGSRGRKRCDPGANQKRQGR